MLLYLPVWNLPERVNDDLRSLFLWLFDLPFCFRLCCLLCWKLSSTRLSLLYYLPCSIHGRQCHADLFGVPLRLPYLFIFQGLSLMRYSRPKEGFGHFYWQVRS
jgi:hypothetical protein